jgi:hypothetical protein
MKLLLLILAAICLVISTSMAAEAKLFETDSYSVNMPNGCKTDKEQNRFSDDVYFECKGDFNFQFEMAGSAFTGTDEELPDLLLSVIKDKWGSTVEEVERGSDKYTINNQTAPDVIATYEQAFTTMFGFPGDSEDLVYMVVGVKMGDDMLYAQYKNDQNNFDEKLPVFEKLLKTIEVNSTTTL